MYLGDTVPQATGISAPDWLTQIVQAGTAYLTYEQQRDLLKLNTQRAAQNLPPIDVAQYTGAGVNVGIAPSTRQTLMWVAAGGLGVWLLTSVLKSRR